MSEELTRRSLELYPGEWKALEALAAQFEAVPPTRGAPSWRTLVKMIARGEIELKAKEQEQR